MLAAALPRYVIEVIAYAGIVAVTLAFVLKGEGMAAVPSLALYALAGNRLVPIFQQFFAAAITIKYHTKAVESLVIDLKTVRSTCRAASTSETMDSYNHSHIQSFASQLSDVVFQYPTAHTPSSERGVAHDPKESKHRLCGQNWLRQDNSRRCHTRVYISHAIRRLSRSTALLLTEENERILAQTGGLRATNRLPDKRVTIAENIALGIPEEQD
jgi:ATP-binding cassette, subfamily B, bacterial PglK